MTAGAEQFPQRLFSTLDLAEWRQFASIEIVFHDRLTVITGANAAGKTTILNLLSQHFGWNSQFVATPGTRSKTGVLNYLVSWVRGRPDDPQSVVGHLAYTDRTTTDVLVPKETSSAVYNAGFRTPQVVNGLYLTSHRTLAVYQPISQLPTTLATREQLLEQHINEHRVRHQGTSSSVTPTYRLKEALMALGLFGFGSEILEPNPEAERLYRGFEQVLRDVLPPTLGFQRLELEPPELVLHTTTGRFALDAISGGIQAIIDLAWQVYLRAADGGRFVVLLDEPENHLHPELQRSLLPNMLEAFPGAQFVVASHNPFVVTSVPDSHVYALRYVTTDEARDHQLAVAPASSVVAELLSGANKSGSSNEVLRDVLGLESAAPLWVERKLEELVHAYSSDPTPQRLQALRFEMAEAGMKGAFPDAVDRVFENR